MCRLNQYQGAHASLRAPSFPFLCRAASSSSSAKKTWQYVIIWKQFMQTSMRIKNDCHLLVVKHHQVTPTHVKAREMIKSILCIINVLIHHERRATSVRSIPQANLSDGAELKHEKRACSERARAARHAKSGSEIAVRGGVTLPKMSYISSAVILNGRLRTYSALFTSGGSRIFWRARAAMAARRAVSMHYLYTAHYLLGVLTTLVPKR